MAEDYGIKISKEGENVLTAGDKDLIFNSTYPALKIHSEGSGSCTFTNNQGNQLLTTHDLGYKPFFAVWADIGGGFLLTSFGDVVGDYSIRYTGSATTTQLYLMSIRAYTGGFFGDPTLPPDKDVDYSWIIFYDPIQENG